MTTVSLSSLSSLSRPARRAGLGPTAVLGLAMAAVLLTGAVDAAAQSQFMPSLSSATESTPGWIFTPAFLYSGAWDDNVTLLGRGDHTVNDFVSIVNPQAQMTYRGRRLQINGSYDGAFLLYRGLNNLNSFDQRGLFSTRWMLSKHVALFTSDSIAAVPTTELVNLVAVPFVQTGSKIVNLRSGVDAALGTRTTFIASYTFDWVEFDSRPEFASALLGGRAHGAAASLRHQIGTRTTLTADYDFQHAIIAHRAQLFDIHTLMAGVEQRLSERLRVFAAAGMARLTGDAVELARTGPAYRAGVTDQLGRATVGLSYSRSLVPAFSFGGTTENREMTAHASVPLARRVTAQSSVAWRRNDPIRQGDLSLRSWWVEATLGYALQPWLRVEGFYGSTHQTIDRPGGILDRNRIGIQFVTAKPLRIH